MLIEQFSARRDAPGCEDGVVHSIGRIGSPNAFRGDQEVTHGDDDRTRCDVNPAQSGVGPFDNDIGPKPCGVAGSFEEDGVTYDHRTVGVERIIKTCRGGQRGPRACSDSRQPGSDVLGRQCRVLAPGSTSGSAMPDPRR